MVVVEYAENGSLLTYLREHRESHNKVALTKSTESNESYKSTNSNAGKCPGTLSERQMIDYGMQIAEGMKYLASQEVGRLVKLAVVNREYLFLCSAFIVTWLPGTSWFVRESC